MEGLTVPVQFELLEKLVSVLMSREGALRDP